jgi:hypothetical protein
MAIFNKNGGWITIHHRPEAHIPHPTYVSLPLLTFLDFWWRRFLGKKSVGVSLRYYWKLLFLAIFDKNGGCVATDHRLETRTRHPTYVFLPSVTFLDFLWRPFLGQKSVGVSLQYYWKWSFMAIFEKNEGWMPFIMDKRLVHLTAHMFTCHRSHYWIFGGY